jgi:hypothetical protein
MSRKLSTSSTGAASGWASDVFFDSCNFATTMLAGINIDAGIHH